MQPRAAPGRYASLKARYAECVLEMALPVLKRINYRIVLPKTQQYNCIAWAAGDQNHWWHPFRRAHCYWPLPDDSHSMTNYLAAFGTVGYHICEYDPSCETGIEKIALYAWPGADGFARRPPAR